MTYSDPYGSEIKVKEIKNGGIVVSLHLFFKRDGWFQFNGTS